MPPLPPARLLNHPVHQLWRERRGQHPDRDAVRQPLVVGGLDLACSWHPTTSGRARYQADLLMQWY